MGEAIVFVLGFMRDICGKCRCHNPALDLAGGRSGDLRDQVNGLRNLEGG
jgi:hypothetical protein